MPAQACRQRVSDLAGRDSYANPGLALQRYLPQLGDDHAAAKELLEKVQASPTSDVYKAAFRRYKAALPNPVQIKLTLGGPLALGLGMSSPLEVGLTTLHTYGMPVIPGSAIKGVCRDTAETLMQVGRVTKEQFEALIGDQKNAALCVFYDAWYVPESVGGKPFHRDVVTVHHPDYYQQKNNAWPTDFDDPNPVPFIVVRPGARFLFAIKPPACDDEEKGKGWADFLTKLLIHAMTKHGVGGKVNAGYGWFETPGSVATRDQRPPATPPVVQTVDWPACSVTKRTDRRGGFSIVLKCELGDMELTQGDWSRLTAKWPTEKRRAAEQGKLTVRASVRLTDRKAMAIEPEG